MANLTTTNARARLRGVVFDMDGTLMVPVIDFTAMYRSVLGEDEYKRIKAESPTGIDILHHIESWSPNEQQKVYEIIADYEQPRIDRLQIMPARGVEDVILRAAQMEQTVEKVSEERLKTLLEQINSQTSKQTKVTIQKRRGVDDD